MITSQSVLECPYCEEIFEVKSPDKLHITFSTAKPIPKSFHSNVVSKRYRCKNPKCRKTITVYWYDPLEYFSKL